MEIKPSVNDQVLSERLHVKVDGVDAIECDAEQCAEDDKYIEVQHSFRLFNLVEQLQQWL